MQIELNPRQGAQGNPTNLDDWPRALAVLVSLVSLVLKHDIAAVAAA